MIDCINRWFSNTLHEAQIFRVIPFLIRAESRVEALDLENRLGPKSAGRRQVGSTTVEYVREWVGEATHIEKRVCISLATKKREKGPPQTWTPSGRIKGSRRTDPALPPTPLGLFCTASSRSRVHIRCQERGGKEKENRFLRFFPLPTLRVDPCG